MAGKGTISVNQSPQYGDKVALESASKALTETPMTGNPTPAPSAGRPPGGGQPQLEQQPLPPAHQEAADEVARKAWAAKYWAEQAMQPGAGPRTKLYAQVAQRAYAAAVQSARNRTPYFE